MIHTLPKTLIESAKQITPVIKTEKGTAIKRSKLGVGKDIGGEIYLHRDYEHLVPDQEALAKAKHTLATNHPDFKYNTLKFDKNGNHTFFHSPDFDTAHEPTAGNYVRVSGDTTKTGSTSNILHHKWLWVNDDYKGFDVNASMNRSKKWLALPNIEFSRIGNKKVWDNEYAPKIEQTNEGTTPMNFGLPQSLIDTAKQTLITHLEEAQEFKSSKTSINATQLPKTFAYLDKIGGVKAGDTIADVGGGQFDNAVDWAKERGANLHIYDPYNRSDEHNDASLAASHNGKSNVVTCNNVLNVIKEPEYRAHVISHAAQSLHPEGTAYFKIYEGDKSGLGKSTQGGESWQNNLGHKAYVPEIQQHFNNVVAKHGFIIAKHKEDTK